jgi:hypothetical protein
MSVFFYIPTPSLPKHPFISSSLTYSPHSPPFSSSIPHRNTHPSSPPLPRHLQGTYGSQMLAYLVKEGVLTLSFLSNIPEDNNFADSFRQAEFIGLTLKTHTDLNGNTHFVHCLSSYLFFLCFCVFVYFVFFVYFVAILHDSTLLPFLPPSCPLF